MKKLVKALLTLGLVFGLTACGSNGSNQEPSDNKEKTVVVKVGVVGSYNDQWETVNELLKAENIQVELVYFSDYATPNRALNDGDIDLNAFQHHAFLDNEINECGYDITAIGDTLIAPLGLYNNKSKVSSIEEITDGAVIAIPSDATNGGRALKIMEALGWIVCDPEAGLLPTVADITEKKVQIEIKELESGMLANLLTDREVTAAFINGGNAFTAGLNPNKDTIYVEEIDMNSEEINRLKNLIAARTADVDNEVYQKIVEAYHTDEVAKTLEDAYDGAFIPVWD